MKPFEAILYYSETNDPSALGELYALCTSFAKSMGLGPVAEDVVQGVMMRLAAGRVSAIQLVQNLAKRDEALRRHCATRNTPGAMLLAPADFERLESTLAAYVKSALRNRMLDERRRSARLPGGVPGSRAEIDPDTLHSSHGGEQNREPEGVRELLRAAKPHAPPWFEAALDDMLGLASGDATMDGLVRARLAAEPGLDTQEVEARRARDRLYQHHKRAREHLATTLAAVEKTMANEDYLVAQKWLQGLNRRQNRPGRGV